MSKNKKQLNILTKIWKFILPFKGLFALSIFLNFCFSVFSVLSITLIKPVIEIIFQTNNDSDSDKLVQNPATNFLTEIKDNFYSFIENIIASDDIYTTLLRFGMLILGVFIIKNIIKFFANIYSCKFEESTIKYIRDTIFEKLNSLSIGFFNRNKLGNLVSVITNDVTVVNQTAINSVAIVVREIIQVILFLLVLLSISVKLTLITFLAGALILIIVNLAIKHLKRYATRMQQAMADFTSTMSEFLAGMRVIKAFNAEDKTNNQFKKDTDYYVKSSVKHTVVTSLVPILSEISAILALVLVLMQGGMLILNHQLESADLMLFLFTIFSIMSPITTIVNQISLLQRGLVAGERIFAILDQEAEVKDGSIKINSFNSEIKIRNFSFKYAEPTVLKNINLNIEKGKQIAFVGGSGSGKSTILDLLIRFYDPNEGEILIDGINIKELTMKSYRSLFGVVSQENILFNDTIRNNISCGYTNFTQENLHNVAKIANCYDFIQNMPNKFDTMLGDRGVNISGGERQRIAIARALLRNPEILIFDEATSALDAESERIVQNAINNSLSNKTAFIVAHRLSTIINCDEIVVFDKGAVVEQGTHEELIAKNGYYKKLYDLQFRDNAKI